LPENQAHDDFLQLCALAASAQLDKAEQHKLDLHLAECPSCRMALVQYRALVEHAIPTHAAAQELDEEPLQTAPAFSEAERELLDRVSRQRQPSMVKHEQAEGLFPDSAPPFHFSGEKTWRNVWLLYAAGVVLCLALGLSAYRLGTHQRSTVAGATPAAIDPKKVAALEQELSDVSHEREEARSQLLVRDHTITDLRLQLQQAKSVLKRAAAGDNELAQHSDTHRQADTSQQRAELAQRLTEAQAQVGLLQAKLNSLDRQSAQDAARAATLEAEVNQLTEQLQERDTTVDQQQDLLAHDRDIRELMGARDLYIAEVYDVGRTGATQKPYGRVFYTKGKSLVFYAYDLDQRAALKDVKTFQAWGRRGPDTQRAVNLGIFYVDNSAKKRWVLKSDDPQKLAQIDAVFVTVEPNGGSHKPSGQPLLFTYLKIDPNHP
jgi:hypothetical protein